MSDPYGGPPPPNPYGTQPNPYGTPPPAQPQPNPYASPAGPVGDPDHRPLTLTLAVVGMYVGAVLAVVGIIVLLTMDTGDLRQQMIDSLKKQPTYDPSTLDADSFADTMVSVIKVAGAVGGVIQLGLWIWMAVVNGKGRNWARITATVFGAIAVVSGLGGLVAAGASASMGMSVASGGGNTALSIVNLVLSIAILVLLWLPASSAFYRAVTLKGQQARAGY